MGDCDPASLRAVLVPTAEPAPPPLPEWIVLWCPPERDGWEASAYRSEARAMQSINDPLPGYLYRLVRVERGGGA